MVDKTRTVLLNAHDCWPKPMKMELWTYAFMHVVAQWNNNPRKDLEYKTPDQKFNEIKRHKLTKNVKSHFKHFHPFWLPSICSR